MRWRIFLSKIRDLRSISNFKWTTIAYKSCGSRQYQEFFLGILLHSIKCKSFSRYLRNVLLSQQETHYVKSPIFVQNVYFLSGSFDICKIRPTLVCRMQVTLISQNSKIHFFLAEQDWPLFRRNRHLKRFFSFLL